MKKVIPLILLAFLLASCQFPQSNSASTITPTKAEGAMSTKVAQILTAKPTIRVTAAIQTPIPRVTVTPTLTQTLQPKASATPVIQTTATSVPSTNTPAEIVNTSTATATITNTVVVTGDPISWLGSPAWSDALTDGKNWAIDEDAYSIGRIEKGHLVISGKQNLAAWRLANTVKLTDAYIDAKIKIDNCSGTDGYGIFFRVPVLNEADRGYLFGITCNGKYFVYLYDGKAVGASQLTILVDNTASDAIIPGASATNRVGVMTSGSRLLFYINGTFVREVVNTTYASGYFGIFVRPQENLPLTIRVDEVNVWTSLKLVPTVVPPAQATLTPSLTNTPGTSDSTLTPTNPPTVSSTTDHSTLGAFLKTPLPTSGPTQTPTTSKTPGATSTQGNTLTITKTPTTSSNDIVPKLGTPDWTDKLDNDNSWDLFTDKFTSARMENGYLVMKGLTKTAGWRLAGTKKLGDAYIETSIKADTCSGRDSYGLFFNSPSLSVADQGYLFGITCDGKYFVWKWDGKDLPDGKLTVLVSETTSTAIKQGAGEINRIGVLVVANQMQFYLNGVILKQISDDSYPSGYFGVFIKPTKTENFTIRIDEINYWTGK